jgi:hypothetical protein
VKTVLRIAAALAVLAFATPVLACGDAKTTAASSEKGDASKKQQTASADKAAASKTTVKTAPAAK